MTRCHISYALLLGLLPGIATAQQEGAPPAKAEPPAEPPAEQPVIVDEPRTIDPSTLMPDALAVRSTVKFEGDSLLEMAEWFAKEHQLTVLFDKRSMDEIGVPLGEPVYDRLQDEPLYFLLGRLKLLGLAWYYEDGLVRITTQEAAEDRQSTTPFNLGDLLDAGLDREVIADVIISTVAADTWAENGGGEADIQWLGDVMFVRQTSQQHRRIAGLLAALRKHGRRTFTFDPPQHVELRKKLDEPMTIRLDQTPLVVAVEKLAAAAKVDIRLDMSGLRDLGVREREPVSLDLEQRSLRTVLHVAFHELGLTWILRDGVLLITSEEKATSLLKTAVYDVRDLCQNESEGEALMSAIHSQMPAGWAQNGAGEAEMRFARDGALVVSQNEAGHETLLSLLQRYRSALRMSKSRPEPKPDPNELLTHYYRLPREVAEGLAPVVPTLIAPGTWRSDKQPDAVGEIILIASEDEVEYRKDGTGRVIPHSVLIVGQTRAAHEKLVELIGKVRRGDMAVTQGAEGFGGGGQGGGFGGGFF